MTLQTRLVIRFFTAIEYVPENTLYMNDDNACAEFTYNCLDYALFKSCNKTRTHEIASNEFILQ